MNGPELKPLFAGFAPRLETAMLKLGLEPEANRVRALLAYLQQLEHWNRAYNLTAIRDPSEMLVQHVFDSLAVLPALEKHLDTKGLRLADMGSGAGLPGVIMAICRPEWDVVCLDAVSKKTAFIRQVAGVLGLDNVQAVHGRIESMPGLQADMIISRAFASLTEYVRVAGHHRAQGGVVLAMKGAYPHAEIKELEQQTCWRVQDHQVLHVPEMQAQRCLLELIEKPEIQMGNPDV